MAATDEDTGVSGASQLAAERKQREDAGRALAGLERQFAQVRTWQEKLVPPIADLLPDQIPPKCTGAEVV